MGIIATPEPGASMTGFGDSMVVQGFYDGKNIDMLDKVSNRAIC
jgi:hypothetical protein